MNANLAAMKRLVEEWRAEAASHPRGYGDGSASLCEQHADQLEAAIEAFTG